MWQVSGNAACGLLWNRSLPINAIGAVIATNPGLGLVLLGDLGSTPDNVLMRSRAPGPHRLIDDAIQTGLNYSGIGLTRQQSEA